MKINQPPSVSITPGQAPGGEFGTTLVRVDESTLQQVADRLRLLVDLLAQANPRITNPNQLSPGQELRYPLHPFSSGENKPPEQPPAPIPQGDRDLARQIDSSAKRRDLAAAPAGPRQAAIPPYDPRKGPQITNAMWTDEMLSGDLSENQLRNIVDPAGFLNARLAHMQKPTTARWHNANGSVSPVNPSQMSSREDAEAMLVRLRALGLPVSTIEQPNLSNPLSWLDYGDDPRRHFEIGGQNVGLLLERYAKYPRELADRMTLAEFNQSRG